MLLFPWCPSKISLASSPDPVSSCFSAKTVPIYTRFQPFQTDTFNSSHCSYQGLSTEKRKKKKERKGVDTAVSKLSVSCDSFELRNPTVAFLVFLGKLISFLPGKGKEPEDSFSAAFENLFDCSNQLSVHLQWQQRKAEPQWFLVSRFDDGGISSVLTLNTTQLHTQKLVAHWKSRVQTLRLWKMCADVKIEWLMIMILGIRL